VYIYVYIYIYIHKYIYIYLIAGSLRWQTLQLNGQFIIISLHTYVYPYIHMICMYVHIFEGYKNIPDGGISQIADVITERTIHNHHMIV
jgi:hypothetical protein